MNSLPDSVCVLTAKLERWGGHLTSKITLRCIFLENHSAFGRPLLGMELHCSETIYVGVVAS